MATVMSNLGLERHLATQGIKLIRTKVGDRHVLEAMRAQGYNVGGEQSGHIILSGLSRRPATGWSRRCRSWPSWSRAAFRRASCSTGSSRCRNCSRMCASRAASRSRRRR